MPVDASLYRGFWFFCILVLILAFSLPVCPGAAADLIPICTLQGSGSRSYYLGGLITTRGVVYGDLDNHSPRGFFIQDENCDGDPRSSDGIFVYLAVQQEVVQSGDWVEVTGTIQEYYGRTELIAAPADVRILSPGHPLPSPVEYLPAGDALSIARYKESLEDMFLHLEVAQVVGPTDSSGRAWIVPAQAAGSRVFYGDADGKESILCVQNDGLYPLDPQVKSGDRLLGVFAALDFVNGAFCLDLLKPVMIQPGSIPGGPTLSVDLSRQAFSIGTLNLDNLFDTFDDPAVDDTVLTTAVFQRRLTKHAALIHSVLHEPDILAIQEAENNSVLQQLALRPEIHAPYATLLVDGPDERGQDVGLLYRTDRVRLITAEARQGCSVLVDGLGPDGNQDVVNPSNLRTCDSDGDGLLDGSRLFSRPPLAAHLQVCPSGCLDATGQDSSGTIDLWILINHFKSKVDDTPVRDYSLARRTAQGRFVAGLVEQLRDTHPHTLILIVGDLNDVPGSAPLAELDKAGVLNLWQRVDPGQRYSYVYQGVSQAIDHILVGQVQGLTVWRVDALHVDSDFPVVFEGVASSYYRSSDHDPLVAWIGITPWQAYCPLIAAH